MKHYVGLDVSLAETTICVVDENGVIIREGFAASEPEDITAWLAKLDLAFERVGLEAGAMASWLYTELRARGLSAICIDPRHLRGLTRRCRSRTTATTPRPSPTACASAGSASCM